MKVPDGFGRPGRTMRLTAPFDWCYSLATSSKRGLPDFLIIGAQKAGTTSLCTYLFQHPDIKPPRRKEIHYFDSPEFGLGPRWYRAHFSPKRDTQLTGEASPYYLCHPHAPRRVRELVPDARLIVLLRDPVERALSHYHHQVRHGREPLSFEAAIDAEPERLAGEYERMISDETYYSEAYWGFSYVTRGLYAEQLRRWSAHFDVSSMLILDSHDFFASPRDVHLKTLKFLNLDELPLKQYGKQNTGSYSQLTRAEHERLAARFLHDGRDLESIIGRKMSWMTDVRAQ